MLCGCVTFFVDKLACLVQLGFEVGKYVRDETVFILQGCQARLYLLLVVRDVLIRKVEAAIDLSLKPSRRPFALVEASVECSHADRETQREQ